MNKFLASLEITFRRDPTNYRPRVNKLNSVKDKEQKCAFSSRPLVWAALNTCFTYCSRWELLLSRILKLSLGNNEITRHEITKLYTVPEATHGYGICMD